MEINKDFDIPFYIFEEIVSYVQNDKPITQWENLQSLLRLAQMNNRLSEKQVEYLIKTYK